MPLSALSRRKEPQCNICALSSLCNCAPLDGRSVELSVDKACGCFLCNVLHSRLFLTASVLQVQTGFARVCPAGTAVPLPVLTWTHAWGVPRSLLVPAGRHRGGWSAPAGRKQGVLYLPSASRNTEPYAACFYSTEQPWWVSRGGPSLHPRQHGARKAAPARPARPSGPAASSCEEDGS